MDTHLGVGKVECLELLGVVVAVVAKNSSVSNACVTLTEDETVSVFPVGVVLVEVHILVVENCHDIHNTHTAADVSTACPVSCVKAELAELVSLFFECKPLLFG